MESWMGSWMMRNLSLQPDITDRTLKQGTILGMMKMKIGVVIVRDLVAFCVGSQVGWIIVAEAGTEQQMVEGSVSGKGEKDLMEEEEKEISHLHVVTVNCRKGGL
jgi:hypothetical protein